MSFSRLLREAAGEIDPKTGKTKAELMARAIVDKAIKEADVPAAGFYAERVDGKVADKLQVVDKRQTLMDLASKDPGAIIDRLKKLGERMARNGEFGPGSRGRDSGDNRGRGSH